MANSSDIVADSETTALTYNNLRKDAVNITTGHNHNGTDGNGDLSLIELTTSGFTTLGTGNPKIKFMKLTTTTPADTVTTGTLPHYLTGNKIINITAKVIPSANTGYPPHCEEVDAGVREYYILHDSGWIYFKVGNVAMTSKPIVFFITYIE